MVYTGTTFKGTPSGEIVASQFTRESLGEKDVLVRITHSGLCGTDLHVLASGIALGHEGVGVVREIGSACTKFKTGDRVGWGYIHQTCASCRPCMIGNEQYCENKQQYFQSNKDQGSMAEIAIWKEDWLFKIPEGLSSENAAPLMCGGATVFTPLLEHVKPTDRVGIVGIGGLGHLAIQFASKMGCEVVVFSGTDSKRDEALSMGAHEFYATKGVKDFSTLNLPKPLDRLVVTTADLPDWEAYFKLLATNATIIPLTVDLSSKMQFPYLQFCVTGITVVGSILASRAAHADMLDFCARNKISPIIEKFPLTQEGVTEAVARLQAGKMRYRGVLTNE